MTRERLDALENQLKDEIILLESMVREAVLNAVKALMTKDHKLGREVYNGDSLINSKRFQIESECLIAIATQQPMARDLRVFSSILEIVTELERIGDYAKGIAKINSIIEGESLLPPLSYLPEMSEVAANMMKRAVKAFVDGDIETAKTIPLDDNFVDQGFNKIYRGLVHYMTEHPESIDLANHLQWAAHNIERMADRVTNICERTLFIETGYIYQIEESDDEKLTD